jgi:hypothetical protein
MRGQDRKWIKLTTEEEDRAEAKFFGAMVSQPFTPSNIVVPFKWGDIVRVKDEDSYADEVVVLPDCPGGEALTITVPNDRPKPHPMRPTFRNWRSIRRVGDYSSLELEFRQTLEPYRKGVYINNLHWDMGVSSLFGDDEELFIAYMRGNHELHSQISASLGGMKVLRAFWGSELTKWRVFIHRKCNWNHWEMCGPFSERSARQSLAECQKEALESPPKRLRHGVYWNTGQINVVVIYNGLDKVSSFSSLVGQGESESASG